MRHRIAIAVLSLSLLAVPAVSAAPKTVKWQTAKAMQPTRSTWS